MLCEDLRGSLRDHRLQRHRTLAIRDNVVAAPVDLDDVADFKLLDAHAPNGIPRAALAHPDARQRRLQHTCSLPVRDTSSGTRVLSLAYRRRVSPGVMTEPLLKPDDVAAQLGVSVKTVRRLIARGELEAFLVTGRLRIDPASVERYLDGHRAGAVALEAPERRRRRRGRLSEIIDP